MYVLSTEQMKESKDGGRRWGGGGCWGGGGGGAGESIFSKHSHPYSTLIYHYFPTFQSNTQQVVVKPVIGAGEFHVSGKKYI